MDDGLMVDLEVVLVEVLEVVPSWVQDCILHLFEDSTKDHALDMEPDCLGSMTPCTVVEEAILYSPTMASNDEELVVEHE